MHLLEQVVARGQLAGRRIGLLHEDRLKVPTAPTRLRAGSRLRRLGSVILRALILERRKLRNRPVRRSEHSNRRGALEGSLPLGPARRLGIAQIAEPLKRETK